MTVIHINHLKCNKCNNHYRAYDLLSFYDDGEGNAPNPNPIPPENFGLNLYS